MVGYFNGNDKTLWVMVQGLVQTLLVRLPMAYIMSIQPNASLTMIGLSAPTSTAVGILLNICFFRWLKRYENQTSAEVLKAGGLPMVVTTYKHDTVVLEISNSIMSR